MVGMWLLGLTTKTEKSADAIVPIPLHEQTKLVTKPLFLGKHFHATYTGKKNYRESV